jgi:hypothetical protein
MEQYLEPLLVMILSYYCQYKSLVKFKLTFTPASQLFIQCNQNNILNASTSGAEGQYFQVIIAIIFNAHSFVL